VISSAPVGPGPHDLDLVVRHHALDDRQHLLRLLHGELAIAGGLREDGRRDGAGRSGLLGDLVNYFALVERGNGRLVRNAFDSSLSTLSWSSSARHPKPLLLL
jgi:hypothetical protein